MLSLAFHLAVLLSGELSYNLIEFRVLLVDGILHFFNKFLLRFDHERQELKAVVVLGHIAELSGQIYHQIELGLDPQVLHSVGNHAGDSLDVDSGLFLEPEVLGGVGVQLGGVVSGLESLHYIECLHRLLQFISNGFELCPRFLEFVSVPE